MSIIGSIVKGRIDRPLGSHHPDYPDMVYEINYGYISGIFAADGEEQDAYILGVDKPISEFEGRVIAVYHRLNDIEDKWIVSITDEYYSNEYILEKINFQEKHFEGILIR